mmetsp:Transcript_40796/g.105461  ORF Transcript_40796/g.105461 Transcript_40796/m.105461 type:complete len:91 (+) Transcript_40796:831-1103(+)
MRASPLLHVCVERAVGDAHCTCRGTTPTACVSLECSAFRVEAHVVCMQRAGTGETEHREVTSIDLGLRCCLCADSSGGLHFDSRSSCIHS